MNIPKSKIAILTTVANFELYKKTSVFFPKGIKRYVIDGTNHMYGRNSIVYMISKFKNLGRNTRKYRFSDSKFAFRNFYKY